MAHNSQANDLVSLHGFAIPLSSFVGRSGEIGEVGALLREYRVVTVTGSGGMGKTRLADEVARAVAAKFADGAWLVELAGIADPSLVLAQVAAALGCPGGDAEAIARRLEPRQQLLVLDNCEHVLAPVARLCAAILSVADDVRVLLTSREPIGVSGEARYRLRPMSLPADGGSSGVADSDAVTLFTDRARQADARFVVSSANRPEVIRLVRRLDGMPLAIELAAARVETLGLAQLADGLDDRFRLLGGTGRPVSERQRSLTATADWSYRLLTAAEQEVFRKLAIFPGAFTLDAANAVAGPDITASVLHLVDCSMVVAPQQGSDGRVRYAMLETLRSFGQDKLAEAGETEASARSLAVFALSVAETAAPLAWTAEDVAAMRWMDAEALTVQQAMAWSLTSDPAIAFRLAVSLASWWQQRGHYRSGYDILARVLDYAEPGSMQWCAARLWLGLLAHSGLGIAGSLPHVSAVIAAFDGREPDPTLVRALCTQGGVLANLGQQAQAEPIVRRALELARQLGDAHGQANALYWLGGISHYSGDQAASLRWARQLAAVDQASLPSKYVARGLVGQVIPLFEAGEFAEARRLSEKALDLARAAGDSDQESEALFHLARVELATGDLARARSRLGEALTSGKRVGRPIALLDLFDVCGHCFVRAAAPAQALTIWAAQAALLKADQVTDPIEDARRREDPQRQARIELGDAATRAAEDRGAAMTLAVATEFALLTLEADDQLTSAERPRSVLSAREQELVVLVARGLTDAKIAQELFISVSTVRSHLDRIRDKTGCRRRADLTRLALQTGLA